MPVEIQPTPEPAQPVSPAIVASSIAKALPNTALDYELKIPYTALDKDVNGNSVTLYKTERVSLEILNVNLKVAQAQVDAIQAKIDSINSIK